MRSRCERGRSGAAIALLAALVLASPARAAETEVERLRKELDETRNELSQTRKELEATQGALDELDQRMDSMESAAPAAEVTPAPSPAPGTPGGTTATARLAPVNIDNPAISFAIDTTLATDTRSSWQSIGYPDGWAFTLQNAELFISAPIDPFVRGYVSINGSSDEGFTIEEAALVTTNLPWNLTVKGGRFFADFGRLPHWHDEALPFVDRPPSIDRLIGGESGSEGAEISWLAPLDTFVVLTGGIYNTVGAENLEALNEDGFFERRSFDEFNVLGRLHTYFDFTDTVNLELGGTWLGVPEDSERNLWGVDATLRHQPGTGSFYQGFDWGTEWLWNKQRFDVVDDATGMVIGQTRERRTGGYTYLEAFFARQYSVGTRFDYSEAPDGLSDRAKTWSAFVTWKPSEFQRLRFQFDNTWGDEPTNQRFTLQWTAFIGSHSHGFAQR
jgi:hypothetical protein